MNAKVPRSQEIPHGAPEGGARVDLNLFRVFEAVMRLGSLTRASEELHLTQPAVSNALARLRLQFEDALFTRGGGRMRPTPLAQDIAGDVAQALGTLRGSLQRARRFDPATSTRHFALGMRDSLEFSLLPLLCQVLVRRAPGLRLSSVPFDREQIGRQLASGALAMAIDIAQPLGPGVRQRSLFENDLCVMLRSGHPLARRPLSVEGWLAAHHVVVSGRPSGAVLEDVALARRGLTRTVVLRCQHYFAACRVVASSDLLLTLPRNYAESLARQLPVTVVSIPLPLPSLKLFLYWNQNADADEGHAWLRARICELLESNGSGAAIAGPTFRSARVSRSHGDGL